MSRRILFIMLFLAFGQYIYGQKYYFDVYGVKQGLSNSDVYVIKQANRGYVWLGTKSGISRFDGNSFDNFFSDKGTAPNGMRAIHIDTSGGIWFGHLGGGLTYYKNGVFQNRSLDSVNSDVTGFTEDEEHRLWISTYGNGVYRINNPYADGNFDIDHFAGAQGLSDRVSAITNTKQFGVLFVTDYGVKYYDDKIRKFEFLKNRIPEWPEYFPVITILEDSMQNLWVGTYNGGLYRFTDKGQKLVVYDHRDGLAKNWISFLMETRNHDIWIGTWGGGISVFNDKGFHNFNSDNGLEANVIRCIYEDREGNILIGSKNMGMFIYKGDAFLNYARFDKDKPIQVNAIFEYPGKQVWLGSNEGLWVSTLGNNKQRQLEHITSEIEDNLISNDIRYILPDNNGNLWIGTWGGGITKYDTETSKYSYNFLLNKYVSDASNGNVSAMCIDHENDLFVGASEGLIYYEISNNRIDFLTQTRGVAGNDITALYTAKDGTVWIGSRNKGLTTIRGANIEIVNREFAFTPTCFAEDGEGHLLVGTEGLGLLFIKDAKIVKRISYKEGLESGIVTALITDKDGNIFIGTPNGLLQYNKKYGRVLSYGAKEGFVGIEVRPNAVFSGASDYFWVGTVNGLTKVFPKRLRYNTVPPKVSITRVRVELVDQNIYRPLELDYQHNSVLIDYKGICLTNASKVRYKVKLEGADHDWQPVTDQTFANYPSLPPGEYTFMVKARNNSGVWSKESATFSFIINPPFWQTAWFYTIVAILFIVAIILFVKIRERNLKREKAELEAKVEERTLEIREKNLLLAKKNKDITDSINYARRIQAAMMPSDERIKNILPNSFIYYRPKDIVSGDFFWAVKEAKRVLVAAADCTGHGVPGAFMSMISISALNKIVKENKVKDPAMILNNLRNDIIQDLKQTGELGSDTKDGLDIALLSIDSENYIVDYAGAYNSLYIVKPSAEAALTFQGDFKYKVFRERLIEVKADRMPIGVSERMHQMFTTKRIKVEKGDLLVITTDGYIDQFGGEKGGKMMSRRFKEILLQLPNNNVQLAYKILDERFLEWRGDYEQIDDVLVIGISF